MRVVLQFQQTHSAQTDRQAGYSTDCSQKGISRTSLKFLLLVSVIHVAELGSSLNGVNDLQFRNKMKQMQYRSQYFALNNFGTQFIHKPATY
jgi:hypothetical protein